MVISDGEIVKDCDSLTWEVREAEWLHFVEGQLLPR